MSSATHATIEAVWRIESARLIAGLTRIVRDVSLAEDLAQDAFVAALEQWPEAGVPQRPGAWLMATARHRGIDALRRRIALERKRELLARDLQLVQQLDEAQPEARVEDFGDEVLGLLFMTCHPLLSREARAALTLRLLGGLSTAQIARAYLVSEQAIAQRIVRAKRTLSAVRAQFELPGAEELAQRLDAVLEVIYLIFNEGYAATVGRDWIRPELCADALRLGRMLAALMPDQAEVHGLLALIELQASRLRARVGAGGKPVLLGDQDRSRWDLLLLHRGLAGLRRARQLSATLGPYTLQAEIAACHARAPSVEEADWTRIVALYDALASITGSPVVELNRAVALTMAYGPQAGLDLLDELQHDPALRRYHLLPSVRADVLLRLGRRREAGEQFLAAAALCANDQERALLRERALRCQEDADGARS